MYAESREVFLLDLCILSYQLHSQTLIWPLDPYYDQMTAGYWRSLGASADLRNNLIANLYGQTQRWQQQPVKVHGPGEFFGTANGWQNNVNLDPILSQYERVNPWQPSFTRASTGDWILYNTPRDITNRIGQVYLAQYAATSPPGLDPATPGVVNLTPVANAARPANAGNDVLYCFEGGTGGLDPNAPRIWSLMGCVLVEFGTAGPGQNQPPYDLYIVFRGSRSGETRAGRFLKNREGTGNPDWVTDLDLTNYADVPAVSMYGQVCRGFGLALQTMLRPILECLAHIQTNHGAPRRIYVTGHSLGGALASHFASAMLLGQFGPFGARALPITAQLQTWPWESMRLVSFSAPVVGNKTFKWALNAALPSARIWLNGDPITQERKGNAVGAPMRIAKINPDTGVGVKVLIDPNSHQPYAVRRNLLLDGIRRQLIPAHNNIPAGDGRASAREPWQTFTRLPGLVGVLQGMPSAMVFSDFQQNFNSYLTQWTDLARGDRDLSQALTVFRNAPNDTTFNALAALLQQDMADFVYMGYLMSQVSGLPFNRFTALTGTIPAGQRDRYARLA